MNIKDYMAKKDEKPLDNIVSDGGFFKIFRTVACIGDSLSSGEIQSFGEHETMGFHDFYEYSWGQFMAREAGNTVYNFSKGGMTVREYVESFAKMNGYWSEDKACQAYIIALGVNDFNKDYGIGSIDDVKNKTGEQNFATYLATIMRSYKTIRPKAKFFLMTAPRESIDSNERDEKKRKHAALLHDFADYYDCTYVLDFYKYAPVYDEEFKRNFYLEGHMNPQGYALTAKMVMSYIDYIIRHNPEDFAQVPFIDKPYHNTRKKW